MKIYFVGYSNKFDEWRDGDGIVNGEKSSRIGRVMQRFEPNIDSLPDIASTFFYYLRKAITIALYSSKRESPNIWMEEQIDIDIYEEYVRNIGVLKKSRGRDVHVETTTLTSVIFMAANGSEGFLMRIGTFAMLLRQQ